MLDVVLHGPKAGKGGPTEAAATYSVQEIHTEAVRLGKANLE
jgi:hypothetical protein